MQPVGSFLVQARRTRLFARLTIAVNRSSAPPISLGTGAAKEWSPCKWRMSTADSFSEAWVRRA